MRARVLVVDDDGATRWVVREMLEGAGYLVATLDRPAGVLAAVAAHRPDLIIMDLLMPEVSGPEAIGLLRGIGCTLPVLILTGTVPPTVTTLGGHATLSKPFDMAALLAAVARLLGRAP